MNAPVKPEMPGNHEIQAKAARYDGIASGKENAMVRTVRPRTPDNVVTQAANVPITMLARVTAVVRTPLRPISVSVRC